MSMPQAPFRRWRLVRFLNERLTVWRVRGALARLGWKHPILWFTIPHVPSVVGKLDERLSVYYCVDDYSALPDVDVDQLRQMDQDLSKRVDLIFAVSKTLAQAKRRLNPNVFYSPHGVEVEHFAKALDRRLPVARQAQRLRHPVVGFFGVLDARMDVDLLRDLADARPQWTILIVGRVAVDVRELAQRSNLVFAGSVPYATLPDWARAFDVCIMPYRAGSFAEHCNPLKLREYLATGKPVISSVLGELEAFAPYIRQATTAADFVIEIEQALQSDSESEQRERMRAVGDMSWEARVEEIAQKVEQSWAAKERTVTVDVPTA
jgi:glycosyltransferase involved in cell wall biosynthesis